MTAVPLDTHLERDSWLRPLAERAGRDLEGAPAEEIIAWAADEFAPRFALSTSMTDAVLVAIAAGVRPGLPALFVDTGYHFAETLGTRDAIAASYPVEVLTLTPRQTVAEQDATYGAHLHDRDPDLCCELRKVTPFNEALNGYDAWASGIRRDESLARRSMRVVEWDPRRAVVKVNPLAAWTQDDVDRYAAEHGVLVNPLVSEGYRSLGCAPCTRSVAPGADPRSGRWAGTGKTECGLHG